jgi:hypothetical protein
MAVDMLRKLFRTDMIFAPPPPPAVGVEGPATPTPPLQPAPGSIVLGLGGSPYPVPVRWYYCQPEARMLPYPTAFCSAGWDRESEWNAPIGEVNTLGRFIRKRRNVTPTTATGQSTCNSSTEWAEGLAQFSVAPVRYDDQGIPFCCGTQIGAPAVGKLIFDFIFPGPEGAFKMDGPAPAVASAIVMGANLPARNTITMGFPSVTVAPANISFTGFLAHAGVLVFGAVVPAAGELVFLAIGVPSGSLVQAGSVPAAGDWVIGYGKIAAGNVELGETLPDYAAVIWIGTVPDAIAATVLTSGVTSSLSAVHVTATLTIPAGYLVVAVITKNGSNPLGNPSCNVAHSAMTLLDTLYAGGDQARLSIFGLAVPAQSSTVTIMAPATATTLFNFAVVSVTGLATNAVDGHVSAYDSTGSTSPNSGHYTTVNPYTYALAANSNFPQLAGTPTWSGGFVSILVQKNINGTFTDELLLAQLISYSVQTLGAGNNGVPTNSWGIELFAFY